jgi:hypothetical protein
MMCKANYEDCRCMLGALYDVYMPFVVLDYKIKFIMYINLNGLDALYVKVSKAIHILDKLVFDSFRILLPL